MSDASNHPAINFLNKNFPTVRSHWKKIERILPRLLETQKEKSIWPKTVFLPYGVWLDVLKPSLKKTTKKLSFADKDEQQTFEFMVVDAFAALSKWRFSQGIYRFDPTLFLELINTPIPDELPINVLKRLPEWCLYIELPAGYQFNLSPVYGFWVTLSWNEDIGQESLSIVFLQHDGITPNHVIPLTEGSSFAKQFAVHEELGPDKQSVKAYFAQLKQVLSLVLYICSEEPEINNFRTPGLSPSFARPQKTQKGIRFFPAEKPNFWDVGTKLGQDLRDASSLPTPSLPTGATVKPHFRRAHWHGYWQGSKNNPTFIYHWLNPIFVGSLQKNKN